MNTTDRLLSSRTCRELAGGVSEMTWWRWQQQGIVPAPVKINRRNFWPESAIKRLLSEGGKAAEVQA